MPIDNYSLKIVVSKATKYKWSDIPMERQKEFEKVDGVIYSLKIGEKVYKAKPNGNDDKWWEVVPKLYENLAKKSGWTEKPQATIVLEENLQS